MTCQLAWLCFQFFRTSRQQELIIAFFVDGIEIHALREQTLLFVLVVSLRTKKKAFEKHRRATQSSRELESSSSEINATFLVSSLCTSTATLVTPDNKRSESAFFYRSCLLHPVEDRPSIISTALVLDTRLKPLLTSVIFDILMILQNFVAESVACHCLGAVWA